MTASSIRHGSFGSTAALLGLGVWLWLGGGLLGAVAARAQESADLDRPSRRVEEIPIEPPQQKLIQPRLKAAPEAIPESALPNVRVFVRTIRLTGNTLIADREIREVLERYAGHVLSSIEIESLRRTLTQLYVDRGYVTSGVIVPDQDFDEEELHLFVVEGRLAEVRIRGERHLQERFVRRALGVDGSKPLNLRELEARLRQLQDRDQIARVTAALRPGLRLGESILQLEIEESPRYSVEAGVDNHRSTVIGEYEGVGLASIRNLLGWGDEGTLRFQAGSGFRDVLGNYSLALPASDGRLSLRVRYGESKAVESPLKAIDIESDYLALGGEYAHPVLHTVSDTIRVGVIFEWRRGRSEVDGTRFSFSEGADRGISKVVPIRLFGDWVHRSATSVIAMRTQVSRGLPILDATDVSGRDEDAIFTTGLLQAQWARRFLALGGLELIARSDLQLASDPLLSLEQFSLGGHASVRGYRENEVVRDNGVVASLEFRMPLLRRPDGRALIQVGPFADVGHAWNDSERPSEDAETLASVGLGLRISPWRWLRGNVYWGHALTNTKQGSPGAQASGFSFSIQATKHF